MTLVKFEEYSPSIGKISLNDPTSLNAMGEEMAKDFSDLVKKLKDRTSQLRALIITGEGRAFSAGGRLEMLEAKTKLTSEENRLQMLNFYDSFLCIRELGVPLIAAINGHAVGAGLCVACACDLRIASQEAKLGFTFTKLGLHPGMGATYFIPRVIGYQKAAELLLTGDLITATEAERIGLVTKVVEKHDVIPQALSLAQKIESCGAEATRQLLESLRTSSGDLKSALAREALCQAINYSSEEFLEGVKAAQEKRPPRFKNS
jgi:enoyl-CoA hydratase/carnithine racemase